MSLLTRLLKTLTQADKLLTIDVLSFLARSVICLTRTCRKPTDKGKLGTADRCADTSSYVE
jgi:hypothetical protein